ncbi:DUF6917 domain-containing protein [Streptomyces collinus]|uniref:DUF6917 domain-containing protein n=1 Tax=Streptomyces collinus TaxID=42684 RepID=UPI00369D77AA
MSDLSKTTVNGVIVKLLNHRSEKRGMTLIPERSRCVRTGEVHELVTTDQTDLTQGSSVERVGFIGFAEVLNAGVIEVGDLFSANGQEIGVVVGFDACHFPNHYNVLISTSQLWTAHDLHLTVGDQVALAECAGQKP